ncbi:MAG TPA: FtsK/SpoIIIE domain-containing protein [Stenomitos sp.]
MLDVDNFYRWKKRQTLRERAVIWGLLSSGALVMSLNACLVGFDSQLEKFVRGAGFFLGGTLCGTAFAKGLNLINSEDERIVAENAWHDLLTHRHAQLVNLAINPQPEMMQLQPAGVQDAYSPLASAITGRLSAYKCALTYQGATIGLSTITLRFTPEAGTKAKAIEQLAEEIQLVAQSDVPPHIYLKGGLISVELPRPDRQYVQFSDFIKPQMLPITEPVKVAVGVNSDGRLTELQPSNPNETNCLISGCNGSGKSEFLRSAVASLVLRYPPERVQLVLIDPKRVMFCGEEWERLSHLWTPVIKDVDEAFGILDRLVEEMEERYKVLEKERCKDVEAYNQKHPEKPISRVFIVIDELAELVTDKQSKTAFDASVKRLGAKGRASGIHIWGATQRPDAEIVTGAIKANLQARMCLRVNDEINSKIALGVDGAGGDKLLGNGDMLYLSVGKVQRLQALYLEESFYQDACDKMGIISTNAAMQVESSNPNFAVNFPSRPTGSYQDMVEKFERMLRLEVSHPSVTESPGDFEGDFPGDSSEALPDKESPLGSDQSPVTKYFPETSDFDLWQRILAADTGDSSPSELIKKGLGCTKSSGNRSYQEVGKTVFAYLVRKYGSAEHLERFKEFLGDG